MAQLGQLIFTGISGTSLTDEEKEFIEKENIGGVILFQENYESPAQLAELVNSIQVLRDEYPLYIAVDHEGGRVRRFKEHFTQFPSMQEVGATNSPKICYSVAKIMADELNACGVNLNFSPVCDVLVNPNNKVIGDRSFGDDPELVSKFVSSIVRGLQTNGVMGCAKHFPGHGCTTKDSHFDLPIVKRSLEDFRKVEFEPFIKAIRSRVEFVMMAHIIVDDIDPDLPCTLSPKAYDLLRNELRFNKLIISDDMQMKAITDRFTVEEAAVMAIKAGADIVEYRDMEYAKKALEGLKLAIQNGELKNDQVRQKAQKVLDSKKEHFSEYKQVYIPDLSKKVGTKASQIFLEELIQKIAELKTQT